MQRFKFDPDPGYIILALILLALTFFLGLGTAAIFMYGLGPSLNIIETLAIYGMGVVLAALTTLSGAGVIGVVSELFEKG